MDLSRSSEPESASPSELQPRLFVCGVGRSGTTVFRRALGRHPEIYYNGFENNLVQDVVQVARSNWETPSRRHAMVVSPWQYLETFRQLIDDLIWPETESRHRPIWMAAINPVGDQMDFLHQLYPAARFVGLVRNGVQVVGSRMKYESFADHEFENHCRVWMRTQSVQDWGRENPSLFRQFRHEWFYDSQRIQQALAELWQWLAISECEAVWQAFEEPLIHPTGETEPARGQKASDSRTELFRRKSESWRQWSQQQQRQFTAICGDLMRQLQYPIPGQDLDETGN